MGRVAIVTDSASDFDPGRAASMGIAIVPLLVTFGNDTFSGYSGLISPYTLVDGVVSGVLGAVPSVGSGPPSRASAKPLTYS